MREQTRAAAFAELHRQAADPDADPEMVWAGFRHYRDTFPEHDLDSEGQELRTRLKQASDERRLAREKAEQSQRDRKGLIGLRRTGTGRNPPGSVRAHHPQRQTGTRTRIVVERGRDAAHEGPATCRLDERDFERPRLLNAQSGQLFHPAAEISGVSRSPFRRRHSSRQHTKVLRRIAAEWDRYDYNSIRDLYTSQPSKIDDLRTKSRLCSAHPAGKYVQPIKKLLRWTEQVSETNEYTVTLKSGSFSKKVAHLISRGAYLSVQIEVGGMRYGPSTIVTRSYDPEWDFEFPRKVKWKNGDAVRIIVTDNYYWKRKVSDTTIDDALAMRTLSGEVEVTYGTLTFASDFSIAQFAPRRVEKTEAGCASNRRFTAVRMSADIASWPDRQDSATTGWPMPSGCVLDSANDQPASPVR